MYIHASRVFDEPCVCGDMIYSVMLGDGIDTFSYRRRLFLFVFFF